MAITFVRPALMTLGGLTLSDHSRSALAIDVERIETKQRMANGTMRKYVVADKRSFDVSWSSLPTLNSMTVDGKTGAAALESLYNLSKGALDLVVRNPDDTTATYAVMFTSFTKSIIKRWPTHELWDVSINLEEV